jgi:hypothetical protein
MRLKPSGSNTAIKSITVVNNTTAPVSSGFSERGFHALPSQRKQLFSMLDAHFTKNFTFIFFLLLCFDAYEISNK